MKEFTRIIGMPHYARGAIFDTLRDAYDGTVTDRFGGKVKIRHYENIKFNLIAAVTPHIWAYDDSTLGDRFIRFQLQSSHSDKRHKKGMAAQKFMLDRKEIDIEVHEIISDYIEDIIESPAIEELRRMMTPAVQSFFSTMADCIAHLRASVDRNRDRTLRTMPYVEGNTRLAQQLAKLAMGFCVILDKPRIDHEVLTYLGRIASDISNSINMSIARILMQHSQWFTKEELSDLLPKIPVFTIYRRLEDWYLLDMVQIREQTPGKYGRPRYQYRFSPERRKKWQKLPMF